MVSIKLTLMGYNLIFPSNFHQVLSIVCPLCCDHFIPWPFVKNISIVLFDSDFYPQVVLFSVSLTLMGWLVWYLRQQKCVGQCFGRRKSHPISNVFCISLSFRLSGHTWFHILWIIQRTNVKLLLHFYGKTYFSFSLVLSFFLFFSPVFMNRDNSPKSFTKHWRHPSICYCAQVNPDVKSIPHCQSIWAVVQQQNDLAGLTEPVKGDMKTLQKKAKERGE